MEHNYRIAIRINNSSFELESTDKEWLEKKEQEYLNKFGGAKDASTISAKSESQVAIPQNLTINEFYKKFIKPNNVTTRPEIAVFFVYYLQKILSKDSPKTGDIAQCFADVAYPSYNKLNYTDILNNAKKKALVNSVNNSWSLTITGEDFVLNVISGEGK